MNITAVINAVPIELKGTDIIYQKTQQYGYTGEPEQFWRALASQSNAETLPDLTSIFQLATL